jgi:hypothetical protein
MVRWWRASVRDVYVHCSEAILGKQVRGRRGAGVRLD